MVSLTQLPSPVDLAFVAGDTFRIRVRVIDPGTGTPVVIDPNPASSGEIGEYKFAATIALTATSTPNNVATFAVAPDPDDPNNAVVLTLNKGDTAGLPSLGDGRTFNGVWDLEVTFPNKDVRTVASGKVTCYEDVTETS